MDMDRCGFPIDLVIKIDCEYLILILSNYKEQQKGNRTVHPGS